MEIIRSGADGHERFVGAFEDRRREVERMQAGWRNWFLASILFLFCIALIVFFELAVTASFAAVSWLEFIIALPVVYAAVFFHAQHAKAREYLEEYSFKHLVARSLGDARAFLNEGAGAATAEEQRRITSFLVTTLQELYTPPREVISKHPVREEDVKVGMVEKLADVFKKFVPQKL